MIVVSNTSPLANGTSTFYATFMLDCTLPGVHGMS